MNQLLKDFARLQYGENTLLSIPVMVLMMYRVIWKKSLRRKIQIVKAARKI